MKRNLLLFVGLLAFVALFCGCRSDNSAAEEAAAPAAPAVKKVTWAPYLSKTGSIASQSAMLRSSKVRQTPG